MSIDFQAIRERHSLASVARRTGYPLAADATGEVYVLCPMPDHEEKTPSMLLHLDEGRYHCFGCGASGDVIQWVRDIHGLDARQALTLLDANMDRFPDPPGARSGAAHRVVRQHERSEPPDLTRTAPERIHRALALAWHYYTLARLADKAVDYLHGRGIDVTDLGDVAGHTPHDSDQLLIHMRKHGFSVDELVDAGLARRREGQPVVDFFQHRVMFAVRDEREAVIGLIGRTTLTHSRAPKYLNSPLTATYDKAEALYIPTRTRLATDGQVVLVEGSLDALAIAAAARRAGLEDRFRAVCTSGLAFSDLQIHRVLAMHPRAPVIALDGDPAGARAAGKAAAKIAQHGREAAIVTWPAAEDPASWLAHRGPEGLLAVTRRGCLEADEQILRPRHAGAAAAIALLDEAHGPLEQRLRAALAPAAKMHAAAAERYATHAAEAIAPVVVAAGAATSSDCRARVNHVIETVARYGREFSPAAQRRFAECAVRVIESEDLAPGAWAERQIAGRLRSDPFAREGRDVSTATAPIRDDSRPPHAWSI